jgi:hypothetical protein
VLKRILFCASLFCFAAPLLEAAQAARADFKIDGRLVDAASEQPVVHARVAVAPVTERDAFTTIVTAEDGLFSFSGLKAGKYTLTAQAHGYVVQSFNQHDQYSSSIVVGENLNSSGLIFRLAKENTIDGTITDEAGEPVRNAQITLYQTGTVAGSQGTRARTHAVTNDEGNYHIGHLPSGDYMIAASAQVWYARRPAPTRPFVSGGFSQNGAFTFTGLAGRSSSTNAGTESKVSGPLDVAYPITFFPGVTEPGSASLIHLTRGETYIASFNLQPVPALHFNSPVLAGQVNSTSFRLEQHMFEGSVVPVQSQFSRLPSGEFEISGIAPGHYTLIANTVAPAEPSARRGPAIESTVRSEIDALGTGIISEGKPVAHATLKATLHLDPGVALASRSFIQLYDFKTRQNIFEQIPANGEIEFKQNVPPGSYEISLSSNGSSYIRSLTASGARTYGRTVVINGATPVNLDIAVGKGQGQVTGVALHDGQPLAGVMIVAVPNDPAHNQVLFRRDQSDSDGTFGLPNVVPGNYTLLAIDNGWDLQWLKPEVLKPYLAQGEAIQVKQSGKYDVKLKVQPAFSIH